MKSKTFTTVRNEEHVISEANGRASREQVIISSTVAVQVLAGTVLGIITATGKYAPFNQDAVDGTEDPVAIAAVTVDPETPAVDMRTVVHARDCEVNGNKLTWPADIEAGEKATAEAALAALGILVRY